MKFNPRDEDVKNKSEPLEPNQGRRRKRTAESKSTVGCVHLWGLFIMKQEAETIVSAAFSLDFFSSSGVFVPSC